MTPERLRLECLREAYIMLGNTNIDEIISLAERLYAYAANGELEK